MPRRHGSGLLRRLAVVALVVWPSWALDPITRVRKDFLALTVRASPRHVMRPRTRKGRLECAAIKKEVRAATDRGAFVVDAFADAAAKYSTDAATAADGGRLGDMIPQGTIRSRALDRACFTAALGEVEGPVESDGGWHLVLVPERINCFKDDGYTRIAPQPPDAPWSGPRYVRGASSEAAMQGEALAKTAATVAFWVLSGGAVAEGAASIGRAVEAAAPQLIP